MLDITTRINALIAYLFLGPLLLLAKNGTPLAEPYVRWHAKKSSLIILSGIGAFIVYRFLKDYLTLSIFWFSLSSILLTIIVTVTLAILINWAYRAFKGISAEESTWKSFHMPENTIQQWNYTEEDKIRIVASFIPFIGINIANKYPKQETIIGRKIGSLFTILLLTSILFLNGSTTTLALIITIIYIGLIATTTVYIFGYSRFLNFIFYSRIPTFLELDASIKAGIITIFDFFQIAFGGEKKSGYQEQYNIYLVKNKEVKLSTVEYFAPTWIFAIPVVNLVTIPSLWQIKYREYTPLIIQWLLLSIFTCLIVYFYGKSSQMWIFLLFPIITIFIESKNNLLVRAPFTSIAVDIYNIYARGQEKIAEIKENWEEKINYKYEVTEESK